MTMESKPRILIVHNYYQIPGGEDTVVANEKKLLEDNGHFVCLYTRHNSQLKEMGLFRKLLLPLTSLFSLKTYWDIRRLIRRERIDIVHVHNTVHLISPAVYYAARVCKVPVVQTVHNFRLLCPGAAFYRDGHICRDCVQKGLGCAVKHGCYRGSRLQSLACVLSMKLHRGLGIYKKLTYLCLTEFNRSQLLALPGLKPEQIFVKPNFVQSSAAVLSWDQRRGFVYAGRLDALKGVELLLEAWKLMGADAPELTVYGTGPLAAWSEAFVRDNDLTKVRLAGQVFNEEVRTAMAAAKAMILPTRWYEGFPMSLAEAFAVGTPVIGPDLGNTGSLILEGINGWKFLPDSPQSLAQTVLGVTDLTQSTHRHCLRAYAPGENYKCLCQIYAAAQAAQTGGHL